MNKPRAAGAGGADSRPCRPKSGRQAKATGSCLDGGQDSSALSHQSTAAITWDASNERTPLGEPGGAEVVRLIRSGASHHGAHSTHLPCPWQYENGPPGSWQARGTFCSEVNPSDRRRQHCCSEAPAQACWSCPRQQSWSSQYRRQSHHGTRRCCCRRRCCSARSG